MESFANFQSAMSLACESLAAEGKLAEGDALCCSSLTQGGLRTWLQRRRAHLSVRRLYLREQGLGFFTRLDWSKLIDWIKENWVLIIRTIITVAPLFL